MCNLTSYFWLYYKNEPLEEFKSNVFKIKQFNFKVLVKKKYNNLSSTTEKHEL